MAYRQNVRFIEGMFPERVEIAVADCGRVVRVIASCLPR